MRKVKAYIHIYEKKKHLAITFLFIIIPFIFFLVFARASHLVLSELILDLGSSIIRLIIAYIISAIIGWTLAVAFFEGKRATVALPLFDVLQSFPTFAALPLVTYFLGATSSTIIFFLVLTIIWPIIFTVLSSLRLMKHDWREAIEISGLKGFDYVKYFLWPVTIPALITGSLIGIGEAWEAVIATEIIVNVHNGLGNFFQKNSTSVYITIFGIIGFLLIIFSINKLMWQPLLVWSHTRNEE